MIRPVLWLFLQSFVAGLLAVFTPFVYTILPLTLGYLSRGAKSTSEKIRNALYYAFSIIVIFSLLGILISFILKLTGLLRFTDHWLFNLFFFRLFLVLGISFMGAFSIKLPASWINSTATKAKSKNLAGIFFMALTLPSASFSSTAPIIVLVLVLSGDSGVIGPAIGLFGFSVGLAMPFVFPRLVDKIVSSKTFLNNVKVILGFFSFLIALKFLSNADILLGFNLLSREIFIAVLMVTSILLGMYMLGKIKMPGDFTPKQNIYGQEYISLSSLFIAIGAFCFAVYLLPGMWGAPLHGISRFLPS